MTGWAAFWVKLAWTVFLVWVTWASMVAFIALHWDSSGAFGIFSLGLMVIWGGKTSRQFLAILAIMIAVLAIIAGIVIGIVHGLSVSARYTAHYLHWS
jgi:hypothetical protein